MELSLGQAAKEIGLDKSTISRAITRGKLSAQRKESGGYEIDPAELIRVFPPAARKPDAATPPDTATDMLMQVRELCIRLEATELRLSDKHDAIRDLRRRLDAESQERRQLTVMLLPPAPCRNLPKPWNIMHRNRCGPLTRHRPSHEPPRQRHPRRSVCGRGFSENGLHVISVWAGERMRGPQGDSLDLTVGLSE
jgi:hypothetical protein